MTGPPDDGSGPSTEQLRIAAIQAVVAAGLAPSTGRQQVEEAEVSPPPAPLPDWTDPPTGQVPRVLIDPDREDDLPGERLKGPIWRQDAADWEDGDLGLAFLLEDDQASDRPVIAGREPFAFEDELFAELDAIAPPRFEWPADLPRDPVPPPPPQSPAGPSEALDRRPVGQPSPGEIAADLAAAGDDAIERRRSPSRHRRTGAPGAPAASAKRPIGRSRNPLVATLTGLGIGAVALACFLLGAPATLALVAVVCSIAAGEVLAALRQASAHPAAPIALVAVPAATVGAYLFGAVALSWVLAGALVLSTVWFLAGGTRFALVRDLGATILVACWLGVPGAFAGLLLAPSRFPHGHGVAFVFAVAAATVAHDVGSYAVGSRFGRRKLAKRVSPNKTWEGLAGGTLLTFLVALAGLSHLRPINLSAAAVLAALVCLLAPLGDLAESLVKRDLALKDMGRLLPAHGGVFDRVDAMLFVLPAAYGLFRLAHLG